MKFNASKLKPSTDYPGVRYNQIVQPAKAQMLRFPFNETPGDSQEAQAREDARLLSLVAEQNHEAFEALYRRRSGLLYSLLKRMLANEMEAQEVLQDTFVRIWRGAAAEFDSERSSPLSWMIMIARGRAIDRIRSRSRFAVNQAAYQSEIAALETEVNAPQPLYQEELAHACATALNNLPDGQGHALQLAFLRGWTHDEIARALGEPLGTIKARIRRGLIALRKTFKERHG
jgi:RNA polymerase sigma-70 factor (ECF subfamily)